MLDLPCDDVLTSCVLAVPVLGRPQSHRVQDRRPALAEHVVQRCVTTAMLRGPAQPDQGLHGSLAAQQRIGQFRQLIGPPVRAPLAAAVPQPLQVRSHHSIGSVAASVHTEQRVHCRSLEASQPRRITRWPPHEVCGLPVLAGRV